MERSYHGKVLALKEAKKIITLNQEISKTNTERIIPFDKAKDIIIKNPESLAVMECVCRLQKKDPCRPLDVCMVIGEPFVSFILDHGKTNTRKISKEEGLKILQRTEELGWIHTAWFKDAMGDRFYAICNCCQCCCLAMRVASIVKSRAIIPSGYLARIDEESCTGCGNCEAICPFKAVEIREDKALILYESCYGCGVCTSVCQNLAITLVKDSSKGEPFDVGIMEGK